MHMLKEEKRRRDYCLRLENVYRKGDYTTFLVDFDLDYLPREAAHASFILLLYSKALYSEAFYSESIINCKRLLGSVYTQKPHCHLALSGHLNALK